MSPTSHGDRDEPYDIYSDSSAATPAKARGPARRIDGRDVSTHSQTASPRRYGLSPTPATRVRRLDDYARASRLPGGQRRLPAARGGTTSPAGERPFWSRSCRTSTEARPRSRRLLSSELSTGFSSAHAEPGQPLGRLLAARRRGRRLRDGGPVWRKRSTRRPPPAGPPAPPRRPRRSGCGPSPRRHGRWRAAGLSRGRTRPARCRGRSRGGGSVLRVHRWDSGVGRRAPNVNGLLRDRMEGWTLAA